MVYALKLLPFFLPLSLVPTTRSTPFPSFFDDELILMWWLRAFLGITYSTSDHFRAWDPAHWEGMNPIKFILKNAYYWWLLFTPQSTHERSVRMMPDDFQMLSWLILSLPLSHSKNYFSRTLGTESGSVSHTTERSQIAFHFDASVSRLASPLDIWISWNLKYLVFWTKLVCWAH